MRFPLALVPALLLLTAPPATAATPGRKEASKPGKAAAGAPASRKECTTARDCTLKGIEHYYGKGVPKDLARSAQFAGFGCDGGDFWGCHNLANLYAYGTGVPED